MGEELKDSSVVTYIKRPISDFETVSWQSFPDGVDSIYVLAMPDHLQWGASLSYPILQSFLDANINELLSFGTDFAAEWLDTTRAFSTRWINDRTMGRRPWVNEPNYLTI